MTGNGLRRPTALRGRYVELVSLERSHIPELAHAGRDPAVWQYLRIGPGRTLEEMTTFVDGMLSDEATGAILPFTVRARPTGTTIGFFRFLDIDRENRSVETGTWFDSDWWRTPANTEVKLLALRHVFETEGFHRVQLRTDRRNERSQRAIERLGGVPEGVHREHIRRRDGSFRTSVVYSILAPEWPAVKARLEERLARPWSPAGAAAGVPP